MAVTRYLGMTEVGEWFGVAGGTVAVWRRRYQDTNPCPEPDAMVGTSPGWLPEREPEWRSWRASLPGQGAGGGPKPKRA